MSYSDSNPAWGRMVRGAYDARLQREAELANWLQAECPQMTRSQALHSAARALDRWQDERIAFLMNTQHQRLQRA